MNRRGKTEGKKASRPCSKNQNTSYYFKSSSVCMHFWSTGSDLGKRNHRSHATLQTLSVTVPSAVVTFSSFTWIYSEWVTASQCRQEMPAVQAREVLLGREKGTDLSKLRKKSRKLGPSCSCWAVSLLLLLLAGVCPACGSQIPDEVQPCWRAAAIQQGAT